MKTDTEGHRRGLKQNKNVARKNVTAFIFSKHILEMRNDAELDILITLFQGLRPEKTPKKEKTCREQVTCTNKPDGRFSQSFESWLQQTPIQTDLCDQSQWNNH